MNSKLIDKERLLGHIAWMPDDTEITVGTMREIIELQSVIPSFSDAETCVCCGEIIPEGRQVCKECEAKLDAK